MAKKLEYQVLLDEEGLTVEELPLPIRKRINVLRPLIAKFNQNPSDKMKQAIVKNDVEIAEMIADYIEKDLPEQNEGDDDENNGKDNHDDEGKKTTPKKSEAELKAEAEAAAEKAKADEEAAKAKAKAEADAAKIPLTKFGNLEMEEKIIENCEKNNGFISEKDLVSIIGKSAEYPIQQVYSISLKKVFMKPLYSIQ